MKELNEKLAEFGGFYQKRTETSSYWRHPEDVNYIGLNPPDFPHDLTACFKWIYPELVKRGYSYQLVGWNSGQHKMMIMPASQDWPKIVAGVIDTDPATTFCLAVEKLLEAVV